jgi:hypothetical protein
VVTSCVSYVLRLKDQEQGRTILWTYTVSSSSRFPFNRLARLWTYSNFRGSMSWQTASVRPSTVANGGLFLLRTLIKVAMVAAFLFNPEGADLGAASFCNKGSTKSAIESMNFAIATASFWSFWV